MKTKHLHLLLLFSLLTSPCWSQISGIVNLYAKVNTINTSCAQLSLGSSTGFNAGDRVLVIQMKGATITTTNTATYGDITALNAAGNYEFNVIDYVSGNDLFLKYTLMYPYNVSGSVQVIKVAEYTDVTVTGPVTALPWDGNIGGVIAIEVSGTLTLLSTIKASSAGFTGGAVNPGIYPGAISTCVSANTYLASTSIAANSQVGGRKGEGISDFVTNNLAGRGKHANGGGAGLSNNSGGGGGGNYGAGGIGGKPTGTCLTTNHGLGGLALSYSNANNRIFLGGGGGGGHQNNWNGGAIPPAASGATPGSPGGGIIIIRANVIEGNGNRIEANGGANHIKSWGDSGGGGGAGGTILLSYTTLNSALDIRANGGNGDTVYVESNRNLGPGGGGGGGVLWVNQPGPTLDPLITFSAIGGLPGTSWDFDLVTNYNVCLCTWGATAGSNGDKITGLVLNEASTTFPSCGGLPVSLLYFKAKQQGNAVQLNWSTAWEKGNDAFIIQRSADGVHYYTLNEVAATACQQNCTYTYTDYGNSYGKVYYKLLQRDLDGTVTMIGSAVVEINKSILAALIYPQPASEILYVELKDNLPVNLKLIDLTGREQQIQYTQQDRLLTLHLAVPAGMYTLWINNQQYAETIKVIVDSD